ncbi:MAG: TrkA family potassium uptake protein [Trichodesmium sp. St16_bin4-tuft]|nr:TrkA family potassium uptake protein [Trichodesmium sp. St5_bin8]MDE5095623.1 TrkA family potassium uptake protein [Trichodesmium sp. St11_bin5]MDE5098666.1 TrkA family potassium uptake protein [Trichodesmium sp. St16_bin4-tuft]MDE5103577.1 TrkA family potassium uptake protein [Trichodesmium sp. St19_bin2]MDT9338136.1 TrkA family potassium uptake protein [Trichodesmium erythraeum 21-75]
MKLSSWNFWQNLRPENKQFAVIGLGRFGRAVCETLHNLGYEVLAIDKEEKMVNRAIADEISSHAFKLDSTEINAIKQAGVLDFDTVIVAIGNYLAESIITTLNLKELGIKSVVAKASSETHRKLLEKVGADYVVFPEKEMGCEVARLLTKPKVIDQFDIGPEHSIVETVVPDKFDGKTIADLQIRNKYGLNLLAINSQDKNFTINPKPSTILKKGRIIVVLGSNQDINRLPN